MDAIDRFLESQFDNFLVAVGLIAIASVALFIGLCSFVEWSGACVAFSALWGGTKIARDKVKNGSPQKPL